MQVNRRLYRCTHDRMLAGVASGLAEYFDLDPTAVRVLWFLSIFLGGLGIFLYIGMAIIVPNEPIVAGGAGGAVTAADGTVQALPSQPSGHRHPQRREGRWTTFFGLALVLFGSLALIDAFIPAWENAARYLGPAFVIGIGILLVAFAIRREPRDNGESMET
jgi:phage shock protein PspC (stress-responsive transcriptional regulator)